MKKLYFLMFMLLNSFIVSAQTFEFYDKNGNKINEGDTVKVDGMASASEIITYVDVKNISSDSLPVYCEKVPIDVVTGTTNTFCWGLCFQPTTMISPDPIMIHAGELSEGFSAHYSPSLIEGITLIKYVFKVIHGGESFFYVRFRATSTGVNENKYSFSVSSPFPNPASTEAFISYNVPSSSKAILQVYNICGKIEKQFALRSNNGNLNFSVSDLPSGIYLCSLNLNGKIVRTNRLIVNH